MNSPHNFWFFYHCMLYTNNYPDNVQDDIMDNNKKDSLCVQYPYDKDNICSPYFQKIYKSLSYVTTFLVNNCNLV